MLKRTVAGITGSILVCIAIFFNQTYPVILNTLIAVSCGLAIYELFSAMGILKMYFLTVPTFIFTIFLPLFGFGFYFHLLWYIYTLTIFIVMLIFKDEINFKNIASVYVMALVIAISFGLFIKVRDMGGKYGTFYIVLILVVAWMTDTGAYFCGSFLGKHKLCPQISPKKTVEGALGGIIVSVLSALVTCLIFQNFIFDKQVFINYFLIVLIAVIGAIISMVGDLSFSLVKRSCNIKDFGNVIPGHGGILDRLDSVIFLSPLIYFLLIAFPVVQNI